MEKEKIEQAAIELCTTEGQEGWLKDYGVSCFKDGARWRVNAAWHDANEKPKFKGKVEESRFLVLRKSGECGFIQVSKDDWEDVLELTRFIKWAYVDDLLPDARKEAEP